MHGWKVSKLFYCLQFFPTNPLPMGPLIYSRRACLKNGLNKTFSKVCQKWFVCISSVWDQNQWFGKLGYALEETILEYGILLFAPPRVFCHVHFTRASNSTLPTLPSPHCYCRIWLKFVKKLTWIACQVQFFNQIAKSTLPNCKKAHVANLPTPHGQGNMAKLPMFNFALRLPKWASSCPQIN